MSGIVSVRRGRVLTFEPCEQLFATLALDEPLADLGYPIGLVNRLQPLGETTRRFATNFLAAIRRISSI